MLNRPTAESDSEEMQQKQRQSQKVRPERHPSTGLLLRICRAYPNCDRNRPGTTSPFSAGVAPGPPRSLAGSSHSTAFGAPSLSERDRRRFAVRPVYRLRCGSGLATRTALAGTGTPERATLLHPFAPAQPAGAPEEIADGLRLVPHALELC